MKYYAMRVTSLSGSDIGTVDVATDKVKPSTLFDSPPVDRVYEKTEYFSVASFLGVIPVVVGVRHTELVLSEGGSSTPLTDK